MRSRRGPPGDLERFKLNEKIETLNDEGGREDNVTNLNNLYEIAAERSSLILVTMLMARKDWCWQKQVC